MRTKKCAYQDPLANNPIRGAACRQWGVSNLAKTCIYSCEMSTRLPRPSSHASKGNGERADIPVRPVFCSPNPVSSVSTYISLEFFGGRDDFCACACARACFFRSFSNISSFGGETASAAARAVQACALTPPTEEVVLDPPHLGGAVLRRMKLADTPGGVRVKQEVLQSVERWVGGCCVRSTLGRLWLVTRFWSPVMCPGGLRESPEYDPKVCTTQNLSAKLHEPPSHCAGSGPCSREQGTLDLLLFSLFGVSYSGPWCTLQVCVFYPPAYLSPDLLRCAPAPPLSLEIIADPLSSPILRPAAPFSFAPVLLILLLLRAQPPVV